MELRARPPGQTIAGRCQGHPNYHPHRQERTARGFHQGCLSACAPFPSLPGGAGAKGKPLAVLGAAPTPTAAPWHRCWGLPELLKGKENCVPSSSPSFPPVPRVLPRCGELPRCVRAARRKLSGCGAAALPGNCSYQAGLCQKGIIIIKPLMASREIRRYSRS